MFSRRLERASNDNLSTYKTGPLLMGTSDRGHSAIDISPTQHAITNGLY
jgi:hypothetical protein